MSKDVAVAEEVITITANPDSTFSYQGADIICESGTKYSINSSTKTFSIDDPKCSSAVVYPRWKCSDRYLFNLGSVAANPTWQFAKYDGCKGTFHNYGNSSDGTYRYYLSITHDACASRNQIVTTQPVNINNYNSFQIMAWCGNGGTFYVGPTTSTSQWVHGLSTTVSTSMVGTNSSTGKLISVNISKLTGNYYFAIQELLTNGQKNNCNINYARLICKTYNYENPEAISFIEKANSTSKTVTITYPEGCGDTKKCVYQKDDGEEVEVTTNQVDVEFTKNGDIVAKVTEGEETISSSYTVTGIADLSIGTVRGGSASLSKSKSINNETISFSASPSGGFTYQGATVVCNNGSQINVASSSKSFSLASVGNSCTSAVVYPKWKKNDTTVFSINSVASSTGWVPKHDINAGTPSWNTYFAARGSINGPNIYYMSSAHTDNNLVRAQLVSQNAFDLTDYSTLSIVINPKGGGTATISLGVIPTSQGNTAWLYNNPNTSVSCVSNALDRTISYNISSFKGNYYLGVQMLSVDSRPYTADYTSMKLTGTTYSYTNRGI